MKFSVTVNDSPLHIVNSKTSIGAVKVAAEAIKWTQGMPDADAELAIVVKPLLGSKAKAEAKK